MRTCGRTILLGVLAVALSLAGIGCTGSPDREAAQAQEGAVYTSSTDGFSFHLPEGYDITEFREDGARRRVLVLSRTDDRVLPANGEGPPTLTIEVVEDTHVAGVERWVREDPASNLSQIRGEVEPRQVDGVEAVAYAWDGLYPGRTVAFIHAGRGFLISGTYLDPGDPIRSDFDRLVSSIELR